MADINNILVTGASGLLGRAVMQKLSETCNVTGVGHVHCAGTVRPVDLREAHAVSLLLEACRPDAVVHCAAYRNPDFCEDNPVEARRLNVGGLQLLCDYLPEEVPILFVSSDYVFDGTRAPYKEGDVRRPVSVYGRTKVEGEDLVLQRETGVVLRIPLLIGSGPDWESSGFVYQTLKQIQNPAESSLDHVGIRCPTWTVDVAEAVDFLLKASAAGIFHYSSLDSRTRYDWARELADLTGLEMEHISPNLEGQVTRAVRPVNTQLDVTKIRTEGFGRFTGFRDAARHIIQTHRKVPLPGSR